MMSCILQSAKTFSTSCSSRVRDQIPSLDHFKQLQKRSLPSSLKPFFSLNERRRISIRHCRPRRNALQFCLTCSEAVNRDPALLFVTETGFILLLTSTLNWEHKSIWHEDTVQ